MLETFRLGLSRSFLKLENSNQSYIETLEWLFNQLPMYQNQGISAYKKDLNNSLNLDKYLNHPHHNYKSIHVAGTNGKGTTCHMLASVLQTAGYKVGLYTSPHLKDFRERIKINGEMISQEEVVDFVETHKHYLEINALSFFEMTVGMAFQSFKEHQIDIAIIETGLGGRLDSTNIITPIISVITSIDLDHTDLLGDTIEKIAIEKAGIIKNQVPVVINEHRDSIRKLFQNVATYNNASLFFAYSEKDYNSNHWNKIETEEQNKSLVAKVFEVLNQQNTFAINSETLIAGLYNYQEKTKFLGRYQIINDAPKVIIDVAHNPAGIEKLMDRIAGEKFKRLHIVFGAVQRSDITISIDLLPDSAIYYLCEPSNKRRLPVKDLAMLFKQNNKVFNSCAAPQTAYLAALKNADKDDLILITGSNFTVAEII